ncbi:hypothetical protein BpHYR1_002923 [Brachionus plicatilis]|uniref:Uncharacterized protein n=1 Tax=Brachionus plicatilis TaxID=10195 RepID=A0A3M7P914_BRAPC|nr:hypothetical protein BpHYR1_002923 [Brachionus plicatilis]
MYLILCLVKHKENIINLGLTEKKNEFCVLFRVKSHFKKKPYESFYQIRIDNFAQNCYLIGITMIIFFSVCTVPKMKKVSWSVFDREINFFVAPARLTFIIWDTIYVKNFGIKKLNILNLFQDL